MATQANFKNFWYGCTGKEVLIDYLLAQEYFCFIEIISHNFNMFYYLGKLFTKGVFFYHMF